MISTIDEVIGDPNTSYQDPEIWQREGLVVWQDNKTDLVWLAEVDRKTGDLIPPDGRGQKITRATSFRGDIWLRFFFGFGAQGALNGPEWGLGKDGLAIYFTFTDDAGILQGKRYLLSTGEFLTLTAGGTEDRRGFLPSTNGGDSPVGVMYFQGPVNEETQRPVWQYENDQGSADTIPLGFSGSSGLRWIPHELACLTNLYTDPSDLESLQIARFDLQTRTTTMLTEGPEMHYDGYILDHPVTGEKLWLTCVEDQQRIAVYQPENQGWVKKNVINPRLYGVGDPARFRVFGVKPFWFRGEPFLSYAVTWGLPFLAPTYIGITSLDGSLNDIVSDWSPLVRADPEVFASNDTIFLYYYLAWLPYGELHRCRITIR